MGKLDLLWDPISPEQAAFTKCGFRRFYSIKKIDTDLPLFVAMELAITIFFQQIRKKKKNVLLRMIKCLLVQSFSVNRVRSHTVFFEIIPILSILLPRSTVQYFLIFTISSEFLLSARFLCSLFLILMHMYM